MSVAIGYVPGAFGEGQSNPNFLKELVELGDKYEYDSIWLSDRIVSDKFSLEPMIALSLVAGYSNRLKFGTSVLAMPLRNPVVLAKQIATLDYLSQGRFFPAVGLGQEDPIEYEACGVTKDNRGERVDEAIQLMKKLWEQDNVTHSGTFYNCQNTSITPKPFLKPSTPVWIGGRSKAAARRVGRVGDGWLVSSATPTEISIGRNILFETADQHKREIEEDHVGILLGFYVDKDKSVATAKSEPYITRNRPDLHFSEVSALGTTEDICDTIQKYIEAGAYKLVVRPLCAEAESMEQLSIIGEEVLPNFHNAITV